MDSILLQSLRCRIRDFIHIKERGDVGDPREAAEFTREYHRRPYSYTRIRESCKNQRRAVSGGKET